MKVARLILVRHGESAANAEEVFAGQQDSPLTPLGRRQAEAAAEALADEPLARIFASDLSRARETAEAIARKHNLEVITTEALREWDVGELEGLNREQTIARYGDIARLFKPGSRTPGGESFEEVASRVITFFTELTPQALGSTVCVVAHGMVNRIAAGYFLGTLPGVAQGNSANTNVTIIETDGANHHVVKLFDDGHVPSATERPEG